MRNYFMPFMTASWMSRKDIFSSLYDAANCGALPLDFSEEMRSKFNLRDVVCCLTYYSPKRSLIEFSVQRYNQGLLFAYDPYPAQFNMATPLGVYIETKDMHDIYHLLT